MHGRVLLPLLLALAAQPWAVVSSAETFRLVGAAPADGLNAPTDGSESPRHPACAAPQAVLAPNLALPHVASALRSDATLDILAVGSATMLGPRGSAVGSYPDRMVAILRAAFPNSVIRLAVHGGRGLTASDMLTTLRLELAQHSYQLVLWQTATVEAIRHLPVPDFARVLSEGAERTRSAGANLILIDPQFSRFLRANANLDPYLQVVQQTGARPDVALFPRYDLMKYWAEAGQIDLENAPKPERQAIADTLQACLAHALAHFIVSGVEAAPP